MTYDPDTGRVAYDDQWPSLKRVKQLERLAKYGAEMRRLQKTYFATRGAGTLQEAKKVERAFDELLAELNQEQKLF